MRRKPAPSDVTDRSLGVRRAQLDLHDRGRSAARCVAAERPRDAARSDPVEALRLCEEVWQQVAGTQRQAHGRAGGIL